MANIAIAGSAEPSHLSLKAPHCTPESKRRAVMRFRLGRLLPRQPGKAAVAGATIL